ncbi:MAG: selenide, water dikinase SelD, partial [Enterobacterales bacterium]|nr:selenide, water dikinase SelD [Enterobacterales bacterium]
DAAVYDLGNGEAIISTTDFFMPIVDDPMDFGRIAATNAISDIYAMGGTPIMAIAIFGWPLDKLSTDVAKAVINGGRKACLDAGIILAGGHSIDAPEPIFGLAVTGRVQLEQLKQNNTAQVGDKLFLTKPLGIGILTTAEKQQILLPEHQSLATEQMCRLNNIGSKLATHASVTAMTDVTGFGLLGHLTELCQGSGLQATIDERKVPKLSGVEDYIANGAIPGGSGRNFDSYGLHISTLTDKQRALLCDPQTSGGLLIAVRPEAAAEISALLKQHDLAYESIGELHSQTNGTTLVEVC